MNESSSLKVSQTNWEKVNAMKDEDIDLSDIPEITEEQMDRAVLRVNRTPIARGKEPVNISLDTFVVEYFKAKAEASEGSPKESQDYQVLINTALREYIRSRDLKEDLRHMFREELARSSQGSAEQ